MISIAYDSIWVGSQSGIGYITDEDAPDLQVDWNLGCIRWSNDQQRFSVPIGRVYEIVEDK